MQDAEVVLDVLRERGRKGLPLTQLYRQMFNPGMYLLAYGRIYSNQGAMTPGACGETADGMSEGMIDQIIELMRFERYRFAPARRVYIPKKNGRLRPLGVPSWRDKLVGEVVRLILEAIYEPSFSSRSHGFRKGRGCHTALREIRDGWTGTVWFIEGDISDCYGSVDHEILMRILAEKIGDQRFLRLIRGMLRAGYMEDWEYRDTLSGVPQGGLVSPVLSNIYLHKLDEFVERELIPQYTRGEHRARNLEYKRVQRLLAARGSTATGREPGNCDGSCARSPRVTRWTPGSGACFTAGTQIYAELGINLLMPRSGLCRCGQRESWSAGWPLSGDRHNPAGCGWSEVVEEREHGVGWPVASGAGVRRTDAGEGLFFDAHVGVQVDLGGLGVFVAEPEGDNRSVDAGFQECHGGGVPERVRGDVLVLDRRAVRFGGGCLLADEPFDGVAGEPASCLGREQGCGGARAEFGKPGSEGLGGLAGQRCCPVLAALAVAADMRSGAEVDVLAGEAGELGYPQAGLDGDQEQGVVAAAVPGCPVGGGEQRVGLVRGEVADDGALTAPRRDRQDLADGGGVLGHPGGGIAEQRVDRGKAGVAGGAAVAPVVFQMLQERPDQGGV